ncbi:MAG: hypothetical protein IJH36_14030, partial [Clostridia bacterium]|nr:hypothetical protein [Clostridia bacterium]
MKKRIISISIISVLCIIVLSAIFWRVPFYIKLKNIDVPKNCTEIETRVEFTDVYWYHIIGERLVKYDGGYEELQSYVEENNSEDTLRNISVKPFFVENDDCAISQYDYA